MSLRVTQLVQSPMRRGAEVFARDLSTTLRARGHDVDTVYLYPKSGEGTLPVTSHDVVLDGDPAHPLERTVGFHPELLARLVAHVVRARPDVLQLNGARAVKYGALVRHALGRRAPVVVYRNIGNPMDWLRSRALDAFYRAVVFPALDGVAAVSKDALHQLSTRYGIRVPTAHIPTAISPDAIRARTPRAEVRRALGFDERDVVALYVGALSSEKRPDRFVRALAHARAARASVRGLIVGAGKERAACESLARDLSTPIAFVGASDDVGSLYAASDLLVISSDTEGIPAVALEAAWHEKPVVATDVGAMRECVWHDETGLVCAADDEPLARAIVSLVDDPARRASMGARGHAKVAASHLIDAAADAYLALYARAKEMRRGRLAIGLAGVRGVVEVVR